VKKVSKTVSVDRANLRATIFHKDADLEAFAELLLEAVSKFELEIFSLSVSGTF